MTEQQIRFALTALSLAVTKKRRDDVIKFYKQLETIDWENTPDDLFQRWDKLLSQANDFLQS